MTITRDLQSATIKANTTSVDRYGQIVQGDSRTIDVAVKLYSQANVQDPRYVDVEMVGLTKDKNVKPGEVLTVAEGDFRVKYVIPSSRWQELLLVKL